jgi:hypothetical protein
VGLALELGVDVIVGKTWRRNNFAISADGPVWFGELVAVDVVDSFG